MPVTLLIWRTRMRLSLQMALLTGALLLGACANQYPDSPMPEMGELQLRLATSKPNDVMVVAHRACWRTAPENSTLAIQNCIDAGIDMVEIDVRRTRDGVLVLMHDDSLDRTTDGSGNVADTNHAELADLRLRQGAGGESTLTSEAIPTLEDVLVSFKDQILINLDCKSDVYDDVLAMVQKTDTTGQILMKMSALPDAPEMRNAPFHGLTYFMPVIYAKMGSLNDLLPAYNRYDPVAYEIVFDDLTYLESGVVAVSNSAGRVWVNTMLPRYSGGLDDKLATSDPDAAWGRLVGMGVNMIQTDYPIDLLRYLDSQGLRKHNGQYDTGHVEPLAVTH